MFKKSPGGGLKPWTHFQGCDYDTSDFLLSQKGVFLLLADPNSSPDATPL